MIEFLRYIDNLITHHDQELRLTVKTYAQSLIIKSQAVEVLAVSQIERPVLDGMMSSYFSAKLAARPGGTDRDRPVLDELSLQLKREVQDYIESINKMDGQQLNPDRVALLTRAANLATSAFFSGPATDKLARVRQSIVFARDTD